MRKSMVLFFLGLLLLNCLRTEASTKSQAKVASKQHFINEQEAFLKESKDSINNQLNEFSNPEKSSGMASWYSCCGGLFAASTKFKKGSVLRVINLANNKYVDVIVNDYGPDNTRYPDRIIDLDRVAFQKIAHLESGLISIIIYPLKIF